MSCLQLCVFNFQICGNLPAGIYEYFFKAEAIPAQVRCQCFYLAVMAISKMDYLLR